MTTLPTILAELEEAERRAKTAWDVCNASLRRDDLDTAQAACRDRDVLNRTHLPTLIAALKRQGEALEPFADFCDAMTGNNLNMPRAKLPDDTPVYGFNFARLDMGHFRRAKEVYTDFTAALKETAGEDS